MEVRKGAFPKKGALRPFACTAHLFSCLGLPWRLSKRVLATVIVYLVLKSEQQVSHGGHLSRSHVCTQMCVYTNVLVHKRARTPRLPVVPRAPSPCVSLGQSLLLLGSLDAGREPAGRSAKRCYIFTPRKQGQVYIVRIEPSFPQLADISALMRVQSSRSQSTCWEKEGKGVRGDVLKCVSALLKVTIYIGLPSSSAAGRWSQQCLLAMCRVCAHGIAQRRSWPSCFFCTKEVPSPLQELKANGRTGKFSSTLLIALSLHGLTILQVVLCVCFVLLYSALLNICINKIR